MSQIQPKHLVAENERMAVRARLAALVEEIRSQVPAEISEEEIERDAEQAIAEVRRKRRARRR
jgi:hypothetical protein